MVYPVGHILYGYLNETKTLEATFTKVGFQFWEAESKNEFREFLISLKVCKKTIHENFDTK